MNKKDYSSAQESRVSSALGWEVVSGSGSRPCVPGDVIGDEWLGECKTHTEPGNKIFFDAMVWEKIQHEAMVKHRKPVLIVDDGSQKLDNTWVLCAANSVNLSGYAVSSPNFAIRKNVSFSNDKETEFLSSLYKKNGGSILFDGICLEIDWNGQTVVVMRFEDFQKIFNR